VRDDSAFFCFSLSFLLYTYLSLIYLYISFCGFFLACYPVGSSFIRFSAIAYVNCRERPLAFYAFTHSNDTRASLLERIVSGGVTINALNTHAVIQSLPFGGIGHSGIGAYHGKDGFQNFSHKKSVFIAKRPYLIPNLLPPFSNFDLRVIEAALKEPPPFKKISYAVVAFIALVLARRHGLFSWSWRFLMSYFVGGGV